jgi:methyl-accepting chemotaxis protein
MSRFTKNPNSPAQLVASIVALAEQSNSLALDAAMEAARADALGRTSTVVDQVCRLAVGVGVACGEITWLVGELERLEPTSAQLAEAGVAVTGMENSIRAVAVAVQEVADRGAPIEVSSSAEALRRVGNQLAELLPRLQREFCG